MLAHVFAIWQRHQRFGMLLLLFTLFRILAVLLFRPGGFISDASDYDFYMTWGELTPMGYRAYDNLWTAYPPLFPIILLGVFEWSSRIPPWIEHRFFFHTLFGFTLLIFEVGNLCLVYRLANRLNTAPDRASPTLVHPLLDPPLLYALLFTPVYTVLGWFEPMPLFFMLLGMDLLLSQRKYAWVSSAIAAGLGFLIKLTPILLVPVAIRWLGSRLSWTAARREWFQIQSPGNLIRPFSYVFTFTLIVVAVGYPVVRHNPALTFSSFQVQALRPPWQSLWALIDGFYGYGLVPIDMRNLVSFKTVTWESQIPWEIVSLLFILIYLWLYTRSYDWKQPRTPVAFGAVSVIALFLYSKGWSPQFLVWVAAFVVLLLPTWRGVVVLSLLALVNVIESYIFLILLPDETWILFYTVIVRSALLLLLLIEFLSQIWPHPLRARQLSTLSGRLSWSVVGIALATIPLAFPRATAAYEARRWSEHPCQEAIAFLQEESGWPDSRIVTEQIDTWRSWYPWLHDLFPIDVVDVYSPLDEASEIVALKRLNQLAAEGGFWWVEQPGSSTTAGELSSANLFFDQANVHLLEVHNLGQCVLKRVVQIADEMPLATLQVEGGPIHLSDIRVEQNRSDRSIRLLVYWKAENPVGESYTVFTQLFDREMQLVAQQDNLPVMGLAPTDTWEAGKLVRDPYRLQIPFDVSAEPHTLLIGMYQGAERVSIKTLDEELTDAFRLSVEVENW